MRHARTLGQRKARARQAGTACPAIAHAASLAHVALLPTARYVRTTGHGARARCGSCPRDRRFPPTPSVFAHSRCGQIDPRTLWLSSRKTSPPPLYVCVRKARTHECRVLTHTPLSRIEGCRYRQMGVSGQSGRGRAPPRGKGRGHNGGGRGPVEQRFTKRGVGGVGSQGVAQGPMADTDTAGTVECEAPTCATRVRRRADPSGW